MSRKCSCEYFDVTPQVKNYPGHRDIDKYSCQVCKHAKYVCLGCDAAFEEIWMFKRKCCATMDNTHNAAYAVGCVSSSCGGSKIARTFDFRGLDASISTTTNYPSNYVESTDNAKELNYSKFVIYLMPGGVSFRMLSPFFFIYLCLHKNF